MDVIRRQAGTLAKAVLEGVMNSIDARSTSVDVTIERARVIISDDGKGFPSRDEIEKFFEVFGQPHDASEQKVLGTFRMGRGQQFAFGRNFWRSGEFSMTVDIEKLGLDYQLGTGLPHAPGCRIEIALYESLDPMGLHELERSISKLVKYAEIPVRVNGTQVNKPASLQKWKHTTDDAWFNITPGGNGGVDVYNLGVHVAQLSSYECSCSGVIVARKQVRVNFARNDIMATCPVWRRINPVLRELSGKEKAAPNRLTASQRATIWHEIVAANGDMTKFRDHKLFLDANGDARSLTQIYRARARFGAVSNYGAKAVLCFADHDAPLADRVMQAQLALVLDSAMLEMTGYHTPTEFISRIKFSLYAGHTENLASFFTIGELAIVAQPLANRQYTVIADEELSPAELIGLRAAEEIASHVVSVVAAEELGEAPDWSTGERASYYDKQRKLMRRIRVGESDTAAGWTDGSTYIAVRRSFITDLGTDASFVDLTLLIMHEYCHRTESIGDHSHDLEFYRSYHEMSRDAGRIATKGKVRYESGVVAAGKRVNARKKKDARKQMIEEAKSALSQTPMAAAA